MMEVTGIRKGKRSQCRQQHGERKNSVEASRARADTKKAVKKSRHMAAQALGRVLINIDPELLPLERCVDAVTPLLSSIRDCFDDLVQFECLMGLTNLMSMTDPAPQKMFLKSKGIHVVEYAQFSSHPMVRRAATECLTNMVYSEKFVEHLMKNDGDRLGLWISFMEEQEPEHYETARAAAGALAMISGIPDVAQQLAVCGAVEACIYVIERVTKDEMLHRCVACLRNLVNTVVGLEIISGRSHRLGFRGL